MTTLLPGEPWFHHPDMACLQVDPDLFFATDQQGIEEAKAVCRTCPLMELCGQRALAAREEHGVWGALDAEERRKMILDQSQPGTGSRSRRPRRPSGAARVGSAA